VAITHDGDSVYVANELSANVTVINTQSGAYPDTVNVVTTVSTGTSPYDVAALPGHEQ
jgi:YVTN family beta-propeller protein